MELQALRDLPVVGIDASWWDKPLEKGILYMYRGFGIVRGDDGYYAYDMTISHAVDRDEDAWAISLIDTMASVNYLLEGTHRRKEG